MLRRCLVILIFVGLLGPALACSPAYPEPRELKIEIVQGLGGDCYYKRIPPLTQPDVWEQDQYWRTEFYVGAESKVPVFSKDYYFYDTIACLKDLNGQKHIAHVNRNGASNVQDEDWLVFTVDDQIVNTYAPIDIIQSEENTIQAEDSCSAGPFTIYTNRSKGFIVDENTSHFIYEIRTLDNHVAHFDLLTGERIPVEQPLDALLMDAIANEDIETVKHLLARGADPNKGNVIDEAPLHLASQLGNIDIVRLLLESGAEADVVNVNPDLIRNFDDFGIVYHHPVYVAAENGDLAIIELLWGFGANINQRGNWNGDYFSGSDETLSPLEAAIKNNHDAVVSYLIDRGAILTFIALELAVERNDFELTRLLLDKKVEISEKVIENAILNLNVEMLELLIQSSTNLQEMCTLCILANSPQKNEKAIYDMANFLINQGASVYGTDKNYPLSSAIYPNNLILARFLLENGTEVNDSDSTPLLSAVFSKKSDMVQLFIDYGADVNQIDDRGIPLIYNAINNENQEIVELLLAAGADPDVAITFSNDEPPLPIPLLFTLLDDKARKQFLPLFVAYGIDVNAVHPGTGNNALQYIVAELDWIINDTSEGYIAIFQQLLEAGIDVSHRNNEGEAVLDMLANLRMPDSHEDFLLNLRDLTSSYTR